jgi:hypothetical protein
VGRSRVLTTPPSMVFTSSRLDFGSVGSSCSLG